MNRELPRAITDDEIRAFAEDGVVIMRGMFDADWIALLDEGLTNSRRAPTGRAQVWDRDAENRETFYDSQAWQRVPEYHSFITESPCAELAGRIMGSSRVNFFFDAVFCRSRGTQFRTPWHQDEPYWSVEGMQTCSIWMPLVSVSARSALAVVPRSHTWARVFKQPDFGMYNADGKENADHSDFSILADAPEMPDIDGDIARFTPLSFDMEPGDALIFNGRCIHGGSGQLDADRDLRVFNTKWCGDDVRVSFKEWGMDPNHEPVMTEVGLRPGDRLGTDLYPELWAR